MQTSTQSPAPAPPQAPAAPAEVSRAPVTITTTGRDGQPVTITLPTTRDEVRELVNRREELSDQLNSVTSRRREIAAEIAEAPTGPTRTGLEDRLILLTTAFSNSRATSRRPVSLESRNARSRVSPEP